MVNPDFRGLVHDHLTLVADKQYADQAVAEIKRVVDEATPRP